MAAQVRFVLKTSGTMYFWTDETKQEMFELNAKHHVWRKPNTAYQHKHVIPTVGYCGGGLMIWACSAATGPGHLTVIDSHKTQ